MYKRQLLRGWRELAGETEFGLRALSAYVGVLTVAVVFTLARGVTRLAPLATQTASEDADSALVTRYSSLVALLLAAVSPVLVYYSQETRMYALLALLAALSTWALLVWLGGAGRRWAVAYVLLAAAGLYTHYFFPAVMAAQGVVCLLYTSPSPRD